MCKRPRVLSCFDKLSEIERKPFALSVSNGAPLNRPAAVAERRVPRQVAAISHEERDALGASGAGG
jgi:hypothetical protein